MEVTIVGIKWDEILITGDPIILGSQIAILLTSLGIIGGITYLKNGTGYGVNGLLPLTINVLESCIS